MKKITIAIDGYSSTGKSTVAKKVAKQLHYLYVDSGAMYRAVTWYAIENGYINETHFNVEALVANLPNIHITFTYNETTKNADVCVNHKNVEQEIRSLNVSNFVSPVATIPEVRYQLVKQQQQIGKDKGVVMDGRDIGTVVFPQAELKIFMTASATIRAERRYKELLNRKQDITYEQVLHNVEERDYIDSHRKDSPLTKAQDAIEIDTTNQTITAVTQQIVTLAKQAISN